MLTLSLNEMLDYTGTFFGLISTVYYARANANAWPIGLVAILSDAYLFFNTGLYGDLSLQCVYFISTLYGWYQWKYGGARGIELKISHIGFLHGVILVVLAILGIVGFTFGLSHYTNSQVPFWDATTTVLSLIAQWLICRKILECWFVWFVVDALYIGLYYFKNIPAHSGLLIIYLGLAILGFWHWQKMIKQKKCAIDGSDFIRSEY